MMRIILLFFTFIGFSSVGMGQGVPRNVPSLFLSTSLGYGTENNWGNTGFFAGIALAKPIAKQIRIEAGLSYFTTSIYNSYKTDPFYANADRKYNAFFLQLNAQYLIGKEKSVFNAKIKIGPALNYCDYKIIRGALVYNGAESPYDIVPGTERYHIKDGFNFSVYSAVNVDAKLNDRLRLGVSLDTYSALVPIEHFMPGVYTVFKLRENRSKR